MRREDLRYDRKSLRVAQGNLRDLAQDCVCFANAAGGVLEVGIEDGVDAPPADQRVDAHLLERMSKRLRELTVISIRLWRSSPPRMVGSTYG